jgi:hypothetical protein
MDESGWTSYETTDKLATALQTCKLESSNSDEFAKVGDFEILEIY